MFSILGVVAASAQLTADWKTYMPFDAWPVQVVETPARVYFMNRTFEKNLNLAERSIPSHSLFYYDKEGDDIVSVNRRANSNGNAVACIGYNAAKKYLLVVYTDCDIDFLYDDGRVFNLPALKMTSIPGKKEANSITFDNEKGRAYVATSFGYLSLNDERHEVAESRNYGGNVQTIGRCGGEIVACIDGKIYHAPASEQRFNLDDYTLIEDTPYADGIVPLDNGGFYAFKSENGYIDRYTPSGASYTRERLNDDPQFYGMQQTAGGNSYLLTGNVRLYNISKADGTLEISYKGEDDYWKPAASYDGNNLWTLTARQGLRSYKKNGGGWTLTRDFMRPNSPATYIASSFAWHPEYGMLCGANGYDLAYSDFNQSTPANISALKGGFWKEYGLFYSGSSISNVFNFSGLGIDPQNNNHVYRSNTLGGIMRVNLANPSEVMIMANPSSRFSKTGTFIPIVGDQAAWSAMCRFTPPQFSSDGTMWSLYNNMDADRAELWYWPAADRLATTSEATYRPMKQINVPEFPTMNTDCMIALKKNKNMLAMGGLGNGGTILIYDHNGTPGATSDDRHVYMRNPYDQDGGAVSFLAVNNLYEDPETGLIWIMSQRGLFTVNPATVFDEPNRVNRIKVARNDGTNLADYLLNEINVNNMCTDGEGRKWFATSNGVVGTSADGRTILAEFTTDNSYLPSNSVFDVGYNPENNSIMIATEAGMVEMFPSGSGGSTASEASSMRVYPNPVEPDYYGWVRIDNIPDGSLVKITDARGGIVRELGPAQGGSVEWDVSGLNNTRVATGVYYIMVSPGSNGDGTTQISKILVLN